MRQAGEYCGKIWGPRRNLAGNKLRINKRIKPVYSVLPDPAKASLGARLRHLRRSLGLTIEAFSDSIDLSRGAIARLERDETRDIDPWVLGRILPPLAARFKEAFPETGGDPYDLVFPKNSFGGFLKNLRARKGLQQRELASVLGVSKETVRRYEADLSRPIQEVRDKLRRAFGLNRAFEQYL